MSRLHRHDVALSAEAVRPLPAGERGSTGRLAVAVGEHLVQGEGCDVLEGAMRAESVRDRLKVDEDERADACAAGRWPLKACVGVHSPLGV